MIVQPLLRTTLVIQNLISSYIRHQFVRRLVEIILSWVMKNVMTITRRTSTMSKLDVRQIVLAQSVVGPALIVQAHPHPLSIQFAHQPAETASEFSKPTLSVSTLKNAIQPQPQIHSADVLLAKYNQLSFARKTTVCDLTATLNVEMESSIRLMKYVMIQTLKVEMDAAAHA